jgi:hypothetical protein
MIFMIFYKITGYKISYQSKRVYVGNLYKNLIKFGSVEILKIFFLTLFGATAWNASAPAAVALP